MHTSEVGRRGWRGSVHVRLGGEGGEGGEGVCIQARLGGEGVNITSMNVCVHIDSAHLQKPAASHLERMQHS